MTLNTKKKRLCIILSVYLIFAVTGSIAVSAAGAAGYIETGIDKSGSAGYFSPIEIIVLIGLPKEHP